MLFSILLCFKRIAFFLFSCLLLYGCGCATPACRIKKDPKLFTSFSKEVQRQVREGHVALGYTSEMVKMAVGLPSQVLTRQMSTEFLERWVYRVSFYQTRQEYYHPYYDYSLWTARNNDFTSPPEVPVNVTELKTRPALVVDFVDGKVVAIETEKPGSSISE
ncbi:hypothetical protein JYU14_01300 [Simkania negevensis]|uniref:Lipoprotein n=1 Tax=Simkania negevensis TaxID=83561 RepID=A0ABS3APT8_9BACT|nr:hypothetical protein [Simkania negevensis]